MGCGASKPLTEEDLNAIKASKDIDRELRGEKKKLKTEIKLLLLGSGEAGKSTFAKQMKILYIEGGFQPQECQRQRPIIYCNIFDSCKKLIRAARRNFNLPVGEGLEEIYDYFEELDLTEDIGLTPELVDMVKKLWADPSIQKAYERRSEFQLNDSTEYFFGRIDEVGKPDYIPNQEDMLRLRNKTSGVIETCFKVKDLHFRMVDVGGQRNERRKWYHCFEEVNAVVFLVAMSEYDLFLEEDEATNRMKESVKLFADVINNDWFKATPIMLFLNKEDLFAEKIKKTDLKVCFQSYTHGCNKEKASAYIKQRFEAMNKNPDRLLSVFNTCATDTQSAKKVFAAVQEDILQKVLKGAGMM